MSFFNRDPMNPMNRWGGMGGGALPVDASAAASPEVVAFFNSVFGWMAAGLGLTALVAWLFASNIQQLTGFFSPGALIGLFIAQILLVMVISGAVNAINANVATILFLLYSALNGITLSGLFLMYAGVTLAGTFLVTAVTFGAMCIFGMVTRSDLTRLGNLCFMFLIGIILASVVNIFFASSALYWAVTYLGVVLFVGLTAYDTQRLKYIAVQTSGNAAMSARYSVVGALRLYLDFLNLFLMLLRILGQNGGRRR
jgi:FtsH-binding integral membrane protein